MKAKKSNKNIQISLFSKEGVEEKKLTLPDHFNVVYSPLLLNQYLRVFEWSSHSKIPSRKARGDVSISKRKIYRQKGTGRARHGARSAPIFVGGGLAHGPKGIKRILKLPSSFKKKALVSVLNLKLKEKSLIAVSSFLEFKKIKDVLNFIGKVSETLGRNFKRVLFVTTDGSYEEVSRRFSNISYLTIKNYDNLNAYDVWVSGLVVFGSGLFEKPEEKNDKD